MDQPVLIVLFVVLVWVVVFRRLRALQRGGGSGDVMRRLVRLETKVDLLMQHAGITYDPHANVPPGVLAALQAGQKIEAIRQYRQATGVDLKTAKEFVESL